MTKADFYSECNKRSGMHVWSVYLCVREHTQACLHVSVNVCTVGWSGGVTGNVEEHVQIPCFSTLPAPTEKGKSDTLSQFANKSVRWGWGVHLMGQPTWTSRAPICVSNKRGLGREDGCWDLDEKRWVLEQEMERKWWNEKIECQIEAVTM